MDEQFRTFIMFQQFLQSQSSVPGFPSTSNSLVAPQGGPSGQRATLDFSVMSMLPLQSLPTPDHLSFPRQGGSGFLLSDFSNLSIASFLKKSGGFFSLDHFKDLINLGLSLAKISKITKVDVHRLKYLKKKEGLGEKADIEDQELDKWMHNTIQKFPNAGLKVLAGHIQAIGINVSRSRLRASVKRIRSVTPCPPRRLIARRSYHVKAPLTMQHIDGHHKLIHWRFVVHGGIDGYSRLITFLKVSSDNKSSTVLQHFKNGVKRFGLPCCVRSDHGLENVGVADYMLAARTGKSYITGTSVHNQRIERLWRDVFESCLEPFHSAFLQLEREGLLERSDDFDVFCLHLCVGKLLSTTVEMFMEGWNHHGIRTEQNRTPMQLFYIGLMELALDEDVLHPELIQDSNHINFAERESAIIAEFQAAGRRPPAIQVPEFGFPLSLETVEQLNAHMQVDSVTLGNLREKFLITKEIVKRQYPHV